MQDVYSAAMGQVNSHVSSSVAVGLLAGQTISKCDASSMCLMGAGRQTVEVQCMHCWSCGCHADQQKATFTSNVALR